MFSQSKDDVKLEWMYKGPNATVDREEYLLGRSVDKTLEQLNEEEKQKQLGLVQQPKNHVEHECIPPSIRDYKKQQLLAEQVDIQNKLQEDPLIAIKKREEECRRQFLNNPVQLKKLQEALIAQKSQKKDKKKKSKKRHASSDSESDIDSKLVKKLKLLKKFPTKLSLESKLKSKKKEKSEDDNNVLDTILMHKFNAFKSKLSDEDMQDILAGKITDSDSNSSSDEEEKDDSKKGKKKKKKDKKKKKKQRKKYENDRETEEKDKIKNKLNKKHNKSESSGTSSDSEESDYKKQHKSGDKQRSKERRTKGQDINFNKNMSYKESLKHYHKNSDKNESNRSRRESESSHGKKSHNKRTGSSTDDDQNEKKKRFRSDKDTSRVKSSDRKDPKMYPENPYSSRKYSDSSSSKGYHEAKSLKQSSDSNSDSESKNRKRNYGLISGDGKKLNPSTKKKHFEQRKSTSTKSPESKKYSEKRSERPKLSREEREKRIKEMMANAAWRDKERAEAVRIHRETESKESKIPDEYNPEFLHKELLKSANSASVESRIKANVNNIQRSSRDMSSNFSKRY